MRLAERLIDPYVGSDLSNPAPLWRYASSSQALDLQYLDVSEELHKRLQRLQNACVRYVCGVRRSEHITPHRKKLDWLDVKARRTYFMAVLMYKSLCLGRPSYLATLFNKNQPRTSGRAPRDIEVPSSRTDTGLNSFGAQGARL